MILTGKQIQQEVEAGMIDLNPFQASHITTNSYDLSLGDTLISYQEEILDPKKDNAYEKFEIPSEGILLEKNSFYLGHSKEIVGSDHYVPIIHAKSGTARLGLFVHVTADLIDIGSHGEVTFQLFATLPVRIYKGMKIAQVTFWVPKGEIKLYEGKYQNSIGPQTSKTHKDFL